MRIIVTYIFIVFACIIISCGTSSVGGTETGTTDGGITLSNLGTKVENVASAIVPSMTSAGSSSSLSIPYAITYGDDDLWEEYTDNGYVVTDVFGSTDDEPAPVTRIRVLLDSFKGVLENLVNSDPDFDCTGAVALTAGDTVEIAFYGEVSNGTAADRYFDCVLVYSGETGDYTTIYGIDSSDVIRVAYMYDGTYAVEAEHVAERGTTAKNLSVIYATYAETAISADSTAASGSKIAYLDLKYNQASLYPGVDETHGNTDDVTFKSRTRITGSATLDSSDTASVGNGDFIVTKYDKGVNEDDNTWNSTTKSAGRGSYDTGDYSLFKILTDISSLSSNTNYFCLLHDSTGMPSNGGSENCELFETAAVRDSSSFPFTLTPAIESNFEDVEFFESDDTDMIANDESNFTIPTY